MREDVGHVGARDEVAPFRLDFSKPYPSCDLDKDRRFSAAGRAVLNADVGRLRSEERVTLGKGCGRWQGAVPRVVASAFTRNSFTTRYSDTGTSRDDSPAVRVKHLLAGEDGARSQSKAGVSLAAFCAWRFSSPFSASRLQRKRRRFCAGPLSGLSAGRAFSKGRGTPHPRVPGRSSSGRVPADRPKPRFRRRTEYVCPAWMLSLFPHCQAVRRQTHVRSFTIQISNIPASQRSAAPILGGAGYAVFQIRCPRKYRGARGTPGVYPDPRASTPRDIEACRSPDNCRKSAKPKASRARCLRFAPQRPRWTCRFRFPAFRREHLSTALGPNGFRHFWPCRWPSPVGSRDARRARRDEAAWTAGPLAPHLRCKVIPRPPLPALCPRC